MRQLWSVWICSYMCSLLCIHPSKILKKYCTCKKKFKLITVPTELKHQSISQPWYQNSDIVRVHRINSPLHELFQSWENGSSVSHRLMFNKEAFVQATDQEFSWTMTLDGSDPLPAKQWFCFKFLCHSCSPQNQCELRLPQPTEQSHETRLKTWLHRVGGFVLG